MNLCHRFTDASLPEDQAMNVYSTHCRKRHREDLSSTYSGSDYEKLDKAQLNKVQEGPEAALPRALWAW